MGSSSHHVRGSDCTFAPAGGAAAVSMASDDNELVSSVLGGEAAHFLLLVGHMLHQTEMELVGRARCWTFRDVLNRLIDIAGNPIRHALGQVNTIGFWMMVNVKVKGKGKVPLYSTKLSRMPPHRCCHHSLGCSSSLQSLSLACSHTAIRSRNLPF